MILLVGVELCLIAFLSYKNICYKKLSRILVVENRKLSERLSASRHFMVVFREELFRRKVFVK